MSYNCKILADSISDHGHRLTTFQVTYPRIVLAEMNTHRMFSRNTASSRAIPVAKQIAKVQVNPFVPEAFGKNQKGMVAETTLDEREAIIAYDVWQDARQRAVEYAMELNELGVHKQLANRVIEPYTWTTQIITATDWDNFFNLRCAPDAQPEINKIALMMRDAYLNSDPLEFANSYGWHLPLVDPDEIVDDATMYHDPQEYMDAEGYDFWKKVSVGRCARVSYLTHDGRRDPEADIELYDRLWKSGHLSPFEHVARPFTREEWDTIDAIRNQVTDSHIYDAFLKYTLHQMEYVGNLHGWVSARMSLECLI